MCGFLGEIAFNNNLSEPEHFSRLLSLSKNRGPDETKIENILNKIRFGFNRLIVIDPSAHASQPMWSPSKRYLLIYNGEIYNHLKLRRELPYRDFKGHGDTETLSACLDIWGLHKTVDKLDGMFAFGVWDAKNEEVFLVRDFAGIKPLYYGCNSQSLVFASQYNQVSRHEAFHNEPIDKEILRLYLTQHFIPSPFGLLNNTYSVKPGEIITFNLNGNKQSKSYWTFPEFNHHQNEDVEILNQVENELDSAVEAELLSDVSLGAFLSGGVDSPLICYFAKNKIGKNFNTFSMGSDSFVHDESIQAMKYANSLETCHYSTNMNAANSLEALDRAVVSAGEPFGDFSIIPTWQVSKLAKEKVTVVLSGDGGDELFFGYERFRSIGKNHRYWHYPFWLRNYLRGLDKLIYNERHINECILAPNPGDAHRGLHSRFPLKVLDLVAPELNMYKVPDLFNIYNYTNPSSQDELLYYIRKAEFYGMLQKTLTKVDRASMAHGLEIRVPFLNKSFVEKIFNISISAHKPLEQRKKILFQLLNKCYPSIIHEKNKMGFSISLTNWIKKDYQKPFKEKLLDQSFCHDMGFEKSKIEQMIESHISGEYDYKWPLFSLYSLSVWNEEGRKLA